MINKISIIIPCYNLGEYVVPMIESVKANLDLDSNIEPIIIDDCSTDNTFELISKNIDSRFVLIRNKKNLHLSETRNTAISRATGDYYFFLDGDDLLSPDFHKLWRSCIGESVVRFFGNDGSEKFIKLTNNFMLPVQASTYIIDANFYRDNNLSFIKGVIYEDNHFVYEFENALLLMGAKKIKLVKARLIRYTSDREGSIMNSTHPLKKIKDSYYALKRMGGNRKNIYLFQLWFSFLPSSNKNKKLKVNINEKNDLELFLKKEFKSINFAGLPILYKIRYILYIMCKKAVV